MGEEGHRTQEDLSLPLLSRTLHLDVRPATRVTWVGAGWSAVCGIAASGTFHPTTDLAVRALLTLFLADPALGAAWMALYRVRGNSQGQPASPEGRGGLSAGIAANETHRSLVSSPFDRLGVEAGLLSAVVLMLGLALSVEVAAMAALGLLFPLLVWFALGQDALENGWTRAILGIGLPWAIGLAAFTPFPDTGLKGLPGEALALVYWVGENRVALAVGLLFVIAQFGHLSLEEPKRRVFVNLPQLLAIALHVVWRQPALAGLVAVLVFSQMLFQPYLGAHRVRWYLLNTQWMFMGTMLAAALGVAWSA